MKKSDYDKGNIETFWDKIARQFINWMEPWDKVLQGDFTTGDIKWFSGAKLNVSVNCLDRHLPAKAKQTALIWESDDGQQAQKLTFAELHHEVCVMANVLKSLKVAKGDRVGIYLPMIPEAVIAMLACARIGAVHTVVFAGFSPHALRQRLEAAGCNLLITADGYHRGGKHFALKEQADEAIDKLSISTLVIKSSGEPIAFHAEKNHWWHELKTQASAQCPPEPMEAEDPFLFCTLQGVQGSLKG